MLLVEGPMDRAGDLAVAALHAPDDGRIEFSAPPDISSAGPVAAEALRALGKSRSAAPGRKVGRNELAWLETWLAAFSIEWVIVHRIDRLAPGRIAELATCVEAAGARLAGVADPLWLEYLEERLGSLVEERCTLAALAARFPTPAYAPAPALRDPAFDQAALRERIANIERTRHERFALELATFAVAAAIPQPERPTKVQLAGAIREILESIPDPACLVAAVAGIATAQLPYGWRIGVDAPRAAAGPRPRPLGPTRTGRFRALWIFRDALPGAACVLTCLPITLAEALEVRVGDVAGDGAMVSIRGEWYDLPPDARPLLRAALFEHARAGSTEDAPLLVRSDGRPRTEQWLVSAVKAASAEASIRVLGADLRMRPTADERWLDERGISLRWLPRGERTRNAPTADDLEATAAFYQDAIARERALPPCGCLAPHRLADPAAFPDWPPKAAHARVPFDTGIRRNAYGYRRGPDQRAMSTTAGIEANVATVEPVTRSLRSDRSGLSFARLAERQNEPRRPTACSTATAKPVPSATSRSGLGLRS
jgi:hypothetical protein